VSDFGFKIGIEGEKQFKNALREINQSFRVLGSEMKLVSSEFDKNDKSIQAITARNNQLNKEIDCERILSSAGSFELTFICPDPNGYAITDEQFIFSTTGSHELVRNIGNINSYPIYQLKGNIDSSSSSFVTITTNDEELKLIGRLASNEILVIDSLLLTAKVTDLNGNTLRNGLPILDELNFPILNKGSNEIIINTNNATFSELNILANSCWR
jgi:phage-related protein